jgi:uncharacterized lipoprotein YajG
MKNSVVLVIVFVTVTLGGCAFGTRTVTLNYPPEESSAVVPAAHAATHPVENQQSIVVEFVDRRSNQYAIGEVQNSFGMHTADVVAVNNVPDWVSGAVKSELEARGYTVSFKDSSVISPSALILSGEILTVYCTAYFSYDGEVAFVAKVMRDGNELINKQYSGIGGAGMNWSSSADSYGESLALALSEAVRQLVQDVERLTE